jgi:superfamily II DNA or RNA helicase
VVEAVTGTGKTMVATFIISKYIAAGKRCLVVVPSIVLLEQWKVKLEENLKIAITSIVGGDAGRSIDFGCPVTIGVVNTIANMADELDGCFDLIVGDECHRYGARVFQRALLPSVRHRLGLTATLERSDEGVETVLTPYFGGICFKYGYREASDEDVIAKYSVIGFPVELEPAELRRYQRSGEEMNDARTQLIQRHRYPSDSEFLQRVANAASGSGADAGLARFFMAAMTSRRRVLSETKVKLEICSLIAPAIHSASRTLIFCETVSASQAICEQLEAKEVKVSEYHSGLGVNQRAEILKEFTHGDLQCVVAVHALDEGVDVPDIDFGVILAGTSQRRQMIQRMGRVLRRKDDGRNACFAVVFAKGTAEDPDMNDRADGYLSTVIEFADKYLKVDKIDIVSNTVGFEREKCREFADVDDTDPLDHVWFELDALVDFFIRGDMPSFGDTIEEEIPF